MGIVVEGPWGKKQAVPETEQDDLADMYAESYTDELFEWMREDGFDNLGEMVYTKDLGLINEAIRSYLMKLQDRYHPIQDVAEHLFDLGDECMYIMPGVYVDFKDEEDD